MLDDDDKDDQKDSSDDLPCDVEKPREESTKRIDEMTLADFQRGIEKTFDSYRLRSRA